MSFITTKFQEICSAVSDELRWQEKQDWLTNWLTDRLTDGRTGQKHYTLRNLLREL